MNTPNQLQIQLFSKGAFVKYGYSTFRLLILEYCDLNMTIEREGYYLDNLNHEYNIQKFAGSSLGRKHKPETIEKLRERNKMGKSTSLRSTKVDLINMGCFATNEKTSLAKHDTQVDAATFLGLKTTAFGQRKVRASNAGVPLVIKAKAEGIKGKPYNVTFPERG